MKEKGEEPSNILNFPQPGMSKGEFQKRRLESLQNSLKLAEERLEDFLRDIEAKKASLVNAPNEKARKALEEYYEELERESRENFVEYRQAIQKLIKDTGRQEKPDS